MSLNSQVTQWFKSNGPNIEPCGTSARIGAQSESWPLWFTLECLSLRKLWNRWVSYGWVLMDIKSFTTYIN